MKSYFAIALLLSLTTSNKPFEFLTVYKDVPSKPPEIVRGKKSLQKQDEKLTKLVNTLDEYNAYHDEEVMRYDVPPTKSGKRNLLEEAPAAPVSMSGSEVAENIIAPQSQPSDLGNSLEQPDGILIETSNMQI